MVWLTVSAVFWIAGGVADHGARLTLWAVAVAIEHVSLASASSSRASAAPTTDWDVEGSHLAERCGLIIIIVLGESTLVTGALDAGQRERLRGGADRLDRHVVDVFQYRDRTRLSPSPRIRVE